MTRFLASAALIFTLSACASALESATQDVTVLTPGAHESVCYLDNGALKYRTWPPETIRIAKRPGELQVRCVADGNREKTVVIPVDHQDMVLANAANGFLPGMFVDYHTGAMFAYPDTITVDFSDMRAEPMPRPAYDRYLMENPDLFGMEEFRPGDAALMRDYYAEPTVLQKRDRGGSVSELSGASTSEPAAESSAVSGEQASETTAQPATSEPMDMTSELTRRMNPQVFGGPPPSVQDRFIGAPASAPAPGGDGSIADTGPVTIYPVE